MKMVRRTAGETRMEKGCTVQDLQQLTQALEAVFEDVSVVELPPECEDHWQDDAMQVSYEQGGGQVSCVLRRRVKAGGVSYGIQMSAPLAGNTLPEDRMTERERELVREDLNRDFLTGAYNRRYVETVFRDNLEQLLGKGGQAAAALVSLDNADQLRYTYGQPALDQIVCTIVNQWKKHYDLPGSRVVCRIHDEILLILCEEMTAAQLEEEVRRHYAAMPCECVAGTGMMSRVAFTLSIGVAGTAELAPDCRGWEGLYHLCNKRMCAAAAAGGNQICASGPAADSAL